MRINTKINSLGLGVDEMDFVELLEGVEGHHVDAVLGGVAEVAQGLAGMGVDNAIRAHVQAKDRLHLGQAGTVEARSERGKGLGHSRVVVALEGIEGLNTWEQTQPLFVFTVNITKVDQKQRILVAIQSLRSCELAQRLLFGLSVSWECGNDLTGVFHAPGGLVLRLRVGGK